MAHKLSQPLLFEILKFYVNLFFFDLILISRFASISNNFISDSNHYQISRSTHTLDFWTE